MADADAIDYSRSAIASGDEDLHLSLRYAVEEDRPRLAALFAFQIELRRIPSAVREPPPGEIRLQWWREALDEIANKSAVRAHPVVAALKETGAIDTHTRETAERLIDARARLLYEPRFAAFEDYRAFIRNAEAPLALLAAPDAQDAQVDAVGALGEAYALARFAPLLAEGERVVAANESRRLYEAHAKALRTLSPRLLGRIAFLALGRSYFARPDGRPWPACKRLSMFAAMLTGRF